MHIAIHTDPLSPNNQHRQRNDWFTYETLKHIIASHKEHTFLILSNTENTEAVFKGSNIQYIALGLLPKKPVSRYRHINQKLPALLKKQQADVLVSMNGLLPSRGKIPCCLVIGDLPSEPLSRYQRKYFPKILSKANTIATVSNFCKQKLISDFSVPEQKINVVYKGVHENFHPLEWEEREQVKEDYTVGREYFMYSGIIHSSKNIINLLKAFSIVKKKLFSNMALVLAGPLDPVYKEFPELLRTYHFRKDVKWLQHIEQPEVARLTGAAYALVCPSPTACFSSSLLEAMACQTPVLAAENTGSGEIGGQAALYFNPFQFEDMGEKLCEIYKNEDLRAELIAKADERLSKFSWKTTSDKLWTSIMQAISSSGK